MENLKDLFKPEYAPYREALAVFEAYRRLGFATENIHFVVTPDGKRSLIFMRLFSQDKDFVFECGVATHDAETVREVWQAVGTMWNSSLSDADRKHIYENSLAYRQGLRLVIALQQKGIQIPNDDPRRFCVQQSN